MLLTSPMPLAAAVARLESKTPVAANLTSAQWSELALGLRERAFFTSRVDELRTVVYFQNQIRDALALVRDGGFVDKSRFIADARVFLGAAPGDTGDITDITSAKRLGLIYDFNVEDAREYGRWVAGQSPALLAMFPCRELVRVAERKIPRGYKKGPGGALIEVPDESWPARWEAAGGTFYGGRMIARVDDPIWTAISRFGRPWPPFDFMSGMGLADIGVDEAERLGVIPVNAPAPQPQHLAFNHNLQASIPDASPAILEAFRKLFGPTADVGADGKITWLGGTPAQLAAAGVDLAGLGEDLP